MPDESESPSRARRGVGAIIVAAGRSLRMGGGDKIWVSIGGRPLLAHTISMFQFCSSVDKIALVLSSDRQKLGLSLIKGAHLGKVTEFASAARRDSSQSAPAWRRLARASGSSSTTGRGRW